MKKIGLICLLVMCLGTGLYADAAGKRQFQEYVKLTRNFPTNPPGMTVTADETYRIIYVTMPVAASSQKFTPALRDNMKNEMIKMMRSQKEDIRVVKNLKISIVYTFITTDKKLIVVPMTHQEF